MDIGWYRSAADNPEEQVCYFNKPNDDEYYKVSTSKQIKAENFSEGIYFKIERVRGKTEKESFDAKKTLEDGASNDRLSKTFSISKSEQTGAGAEKDMVTLLSTFTEEIGGQQDQNFSQDNNDVPKKNKKENGKIKL